MVKETICFASRNIAENYPKLYSSDCKMVQGDESYYHSYQGKGITINLQPFSSKIPFADCNHCQSNYIKIINTHSPFISNRVMRIGVMSFIATIAKDM